MRRHALGVAALLAAAGLLPAGAAVAREKARPSAGLGACIGSTIGGAVGGIVGAGIGAAWGAGIDQENSACITSAPPCPANGCKGYSTSPRPPFPSFEEFMSKQMGSSNCVA